MAQRKGKVPFARERIRVRRTKHPRGSLDQSAQHSLGLLEAHVLDHREPQIPRIDHHLRALGWQDAARRVEHLLAHRSRLLEAPRLEKNLPQAAARANRLVRRLVRDRRDELAVHTLRFPVPALELEALGRSGHQTSQERKPGNTRDP